MFLGYFLPSAVGVGVFVSLLFALSIYSKRNDVADVAWGPGIALATWIAWYTLGATVNVPALVVLALISVWAARLAWRIGKKNARKSEDARYRRWRESWGKIFYLRSFLQIYILQGTLMLFLASSAVALFTGPSQSSPYLWLAVGVWLLGFYFEVIGDSQLDRFLKNPENKGKLMRYGLWRYTRHPNYFGEITMWWAIALVALLCGAPLWALVSPVTITLLICFVSGIPLLEEAFKDHPEWKEYKEKTSVLIPWFVKE